MCVHCDAVTTALDIIDKYGWAVSTCEGSTDEDSHVPLAYSTGLTVRGLPEVIVYGLHADLGVTMVNYVASRLIDGDHIEQGTVLSGVMPIFDVTFVDVIDTADFGIAHDLYDDVVALQVVWPDIDGRYPWEPGYCLDADRQPLMGVLR